MPGGDNGGARIFVLELLKHLAEVAPRAHFILLTQAASHDQLAELERANVTRRMVLGPLVGNALRPRLMALAGAALPVMPTALRGLLSRLGYAVNAALKRGGSRRRLRDLGVELLFCPFTAPTYWEPGVATVCTLYDLQFRLYPEFFAAEDLANRERSFAEASRRASLLVAISDYARATAIAHGDLDPARVRTVPLRMALRLAQASGDPGMSLPALGLEPGGYLLYPANFWAHKNHERLLLGFQAARRKGLADHIKLVCTGAPGAGMERVRGCLAALRLERHVCLPGYVSDADLAMLVRHAVGVVFPSLYEGFGLPVLEAMTAEVPVACSRCTALPEVAGDAAIYFDPQAPADIARAICLLTGDERERAALVRRGRERAVQYGDVRQMALDYWGVFQEAMSGS
nr:glycosyltransferase [Thiocystis violacea]